MPRLGRFGGFLRRLARNVAGTEGEIRIVCGWEVEPNCQFALAHAWLKRLKCRLAQRGYTATFHSPRNETALREVLEARVIGPVDILVFVGHFVERKPPVPADAVLALQGTPNASSAPVFVRDCQFRAWTIPEERVLVWLMCESHHLQTLIQNPTSRRACIWSTDRETRVPEALYYVTRLLEHFVHGSLFSRASLHKAHRRALEDLCRMM